MPAASSSDFEKKLDFGVEKPFSGGLFSDFVSIWKTWGVLGNIFLGKLPSGSIIKVANLLCQGRAKSFSGER